MLAKIREAPLKRGVGLFVGALTAWLRARHAEASAGMPQVSA
jgi:hypothetical protein